MRPCVRLALVLPVLAAVLAAPAVAQFKPKLPKLSRPGAVKPGAATPRGPTYDERVLEITDGRVDQLLKGFAAEVVALDEAESRRAADRAAYEEANRKHAGALKDYQAKKQSYDACQEREVKPVQAQAQKDAQKTQDEITGGDEEAFNRKMDEVKSRMQAAQARGDMAEVMRLADSLSTHVGMKSGAAANASAAKMQAARSKCGAEPAEPEPPTPPSDAAYDPDASGAKAAGLTRDQYAIMKERVRYAVQEDGEVEVASSSWAFSSNELSVLKSRGKELRKGFEPIQERGH